MGDVVEAGIVVIGNEVLSGSVEDLNSTFLMREFRALGMAVKKVAIVPDEHEVIRDEVRAFAKAFGVVVTTGGVGPTHDDITFEAVAAAFGREMVHSDEMERVIREFFGARVNETWLRMARVPEGTELVWSEGLPFPVTKLENVYVLPGEPTVMRAKFAGIRERFRQEPIHVRQLWLDLEEGDVAAALPDLEKTFGVLVGSYPTYAKTDYRVRLSVEGRDPSRVDAAFDELRRRVPRSAVVREA